MKIVISFLFMLILSVHMYGRLKDYTRFNYLVSPKYELRSNAITAIVQDSVGLIWVGTRNGLFKYNGNDYKEVSKVNDYLKSKLKEDITALHFDIRGWLWIGSMSGLSIYNPKTNIIHNLAKEVNYISSINYISSTIKGDVIVAMHRKLFAYISSTKKFKDITPKIKKRHKLLRIYSVCQTKDETIWVSTSIGLCKLINEGIDYKLEKFMDFDDIIGTEIIKRKQIKLLEDARGNILVGTYNGLFKFDSKSSKLVPFIKQLYTPPNNNIKDFVIDKQGRLWVGTMNGIFVYNYKKLRAMSYDPQNTRGLSDDRIRALFVDRNNTVWVGTYFGGVNYWNERNPQFYHLSDKTKSGLSDKTVRYIAEDDKGIVYFGTEKNGVTAHNPKTGSFFNLHQNKDQIYSSVIYILPDKNDLWLGTAKSGLVRYNTQSYKQKVFMPELIRSTRLEGNRILSIVKQTDSLFYISVKFKGLFKFNPKTGIFKEINLKGISEKIEIFYKMILDHSGNLWLSSPHRLLMIKSDSLKKENYSFEEILCRKNGSVSVNDLYENKDSSIWIAGINGLLYRYHKSELKKIVDTNKLSFFSIISGEGNDLWFSSSEGVLQINTETKKIKIFNDKHGLQINAFCNASKMKSKNGNIYFGGTSGVTYFKPSVFAKEKADTASVIITDFLVNNKPIVVGDDTNILSESIEFTKEVELEYTHNMFAIKFACGNLGYAVRCNFEYRLKGFNDEWIKTNNSSVSYTLQTGGEYLFEVRCLNSNGERISSTKTLKITLENPYWKTKWAYLLYFLFVFFVLGIFLYLYRSRIEVSFKLDMELADIERQKQVHKQKLNFFTNVSHDFRTPLTLIIGAVDQFITKYHLSHEMHRGLKSVQKNTNQLLSLVNDLMDFQKIEEKQLQLHVAENDITDFVNEVFLSFKVKAEVNKINYTFNSDKIKQTIFFDSQKMERVINNLLANAFKFTDKGGEITIDISEESEEVLITIKDTGCGIPLENQKYVFDRFYENNREGRKELSGTGIGLSVSKSIVELHKGNITFHSKENKGATFKISLLKGTMHFKSEDILIGRGNDVSQIKNQQCDIKENQYEKINSIVEDTWRTEKKDYSILIAEDNEELGFYLKDALSTYFNVTLVVDGREAFKSVLNMPPDLIISDVMMPNMDGIEFCKKIKMTTETSYIPFVLLTARTSVDYRYEGLESGANEYINKPFNLKELVLKCINILRTQKDLRDRFMRMDEPIKENYEVLDPDKELYERAMIILNKNVGNEYFGVQDLCMEIGLSRSVLYTKVKKWTDQSPGELLLGFRMKHAAKLLEKRQYSISQIANMVGFKRANYFSKCFKNYHELSPSEYVKKYC